MNFRSPILSHLGLSVIKEECMDEKQLIEWVISYCKDELTSSEAKALQAYLDENEQHQVAFRAYLNKYRRMRQVGLYYSMDDRQAWEMISRRIGRGRATRGYTRFRRYLPYAALFAILVSVSVYFYTRDTFRSGLSLATVHPGMPMAVLELSDGREVSLAQDSVLSLMEVNGCVIESNEGGGIRYLPTENTGERVCNTIRVPRGGEYYLQLPDGTQVWLNSESELTYAISSGESTREVKLRGEAYFEVARDTNRPFQVKSKDSRIRVLGTKFNIMAYDDQTDVVTTLVDGRVSVLIGKDSLILMPGEQARSSAGGIELKKVDAGMYTAWKSGVFEFEKMTLEQITRQLERWYDVTFVYFSEEVKEITFTGAAGRHGDLQVILEMIEQLSKVKFTRDKNNIVVTKQ